MAWKILLFLFTVKMTKSSCPHEDTLLKPWSQPSSWPQNQIPKKYDAVKVTGFILLDITPPELQSITISPNGRLVWSPSRTITLKTKYIHIRGRMEIGSESCPFTGNTTIILTGKRGGYNITGFGEKFIGVDNYGSLDMHGSKKLSWTKLDKTLHKLTMGNGYIYLHQKGKYYKKDDWMEGLAAYILDPETDSIDNFRLFYLSGHNKEMTNYHVKDVGPYLESIKPGRLLVMMAQHSLCRSSDLSTVYDIIENFAFGYVIGSSLIRSIRGDAAYVMIAKQGDPSLTIEKAGETPTGQQYSEATAHLTLWNRKRKYTVQSRIDFNQKWKSFIDFRISDTHYSYPIIDVIDNVETWNHGDRVVLTSTDFDWKQAEEATVVPCSFCAPNQIRLDLETRYTHWGTVVDNVDMRGEVALLSRNIVIEGQMERTCPKLNKNCDRYNFDTYGGHLIVQGSFQRARIEGVELRFMGSQTDTSRYPLHFHFCGDVDDPAMYPHSPYIYNNSIHHSFARCVTIHATSGLQIKDNVCFDCLGHAYFIEEGGEKRTVLDGNLGISTRQGSLIPSDQSPTTFWITNPLTTVRNNVAAGSQHTGFWFLFPDQPIGQSAGLGFMNKGEAMLTAISEVYNNVAHSNHVIGLNIDQKLMPDFSAGLTNGYEPKEDALNKTSLDKEVLIDKITCFKNNMHNMWIRGGMIHVKRASLAESARSLTFARSGSQSQRLTQSVILGETANIGEPTKSWNRETNSFITLPRSMPIPWDIKHPIMGFTIYDGPVYVDNVWFGDFLKKDNYSVHALGFQLHNLFSSSPVSAVSRLKFGFSDGISNGNRIFDGNESYYGYSNFDGDKGATIRDLDGSLTSFPGYQIVKPYQFYVTPACRYRKNWNLALCPHRYGKLSVRIINPGDKSIMPLMVREDIPYMDEVMEGKASVPEFLVILGESYIYSLHWKSQVPQQFDVYGEGIELDFPVILGICLPRDSVFELHSWSPVWKPNLKSWTIAKSKVEVADDQNGGTYYWNKDSGLLYLKFQSFNKRALNSSTNCNGTCPAVKVTILSGDLVDADCRNRAYGQLRHTNQQRMTSFSRILPTASRSPSKDIGAGPTRPRTYQISVNGAADLTSSFKQCWLACTKKMRCSSPKSQKFGYFLN